MRCYSLAQHYSSRSYQYKFHTAPLSENSNNHTLPILVEDKAEGLTTRQMEKYPATLQEEKQPPKMAGEVERQTGPHPFDTLRKGRFQSRPPVHTPPRGEEWESLTPLYSSAEE